MPTVTLSLPLAIGLLILLVAIGAGSVYAFARSTPAIVIPPTITPTPTVTSTITPTLTSTPTSTVVPTFTPLPDKEYVVKPQDTCSKIAILFNVSVNSIVLKNGLSADCASLSVGQKLVIPQPTPTPTSQVTSTPNAVATTDKTCELFPYTVVQGDTLGIISAKYNVASQSIREYNGMSSDIVQLGQRINIPLCKRLPTPGPTSTPTPPPPYLAPNLLLPADGASYVASSEVITLQWSTVGNLRQNESYAVTVEDLTDGTGKKVIDYVTDTKYIVPASLRPTDTTPHVFRWSVMAVRQTGTSKDGQPTYEVGGAVSNPRVFSWLGGGAPVPTSKP
jgi:LysM repeat protein